MAVGEKGKVSSSEKDANILKRIAKSLSNLIKGFKAEIKRVTWPNKKEIKKVSTAVLLICVIYVAYITVADTIFSNLFGLLFK